VQARWRYALYQSEYESTKDGSMPAHVLRYSAVSNNLTPKLTVSDRVEIIRGHYSAYVQRTILSVGLWIICYAVRNKINRQNHTEERNRTRGHLPKIVNASDSKAEPNQDKCYGVISGCQNVRNMRHKGTHNYDRNRQCSQSNNRLERGSLNSSREGRIYKKEQCKYPATINAEI
jgi:hypothetical protein